MDHGNCAGSCLMLALLRPHIYGCLDGAVPCRLFGYPAPLQLLRADPNPHSSGTGPDNARTNILEALTAHWNTMPENQAAALALNRLQDTWRVMRLHVDMALRELALGGRPPNAHYIIGKALEVQDNIIP